MSGPVEGTLLWEPSPSFKEHSVMAEYLRWLAAQGRPFADYHDLWRWSVDDLEGFWASIAEFFGVVTSRPPDRILARRAMPGARWFEGAQLNYVDNVFRHATGERPAILYAAEGRAPRAISWDELRRRVGAAAAGLRRLGVRRGDRVGAYLPNVPEAVVAFLACAGLGVTWSSCSPDFGARSVVDRFAQIGPRVLIACEGYTYGGRAFDRRETVSDLRRALPTLEHTVVVPKEGQQAPATAGALAWADLLARPGRADSWEQVPFDHPLWVVYSSGTTGLPKPIVHGHGGIVLEHSKIGGLHLGLRPGDRFFWYTSTGWIMWNVVVGGLLRGATIVLYDGSAGHPDLDVLWRLAEEAGINVFGTSAAFLTSCMKAGLEPGRRYDLGQLRAIGSTGSPLPPEGFGWVYDAVKRDVWLVSTSGGTDPASGFVGGCPLLPVHAGEIQCRLLGVNAQAFDDAGRPVVGRVGELVITEPMPSMPLYFWNDPGDRRYRESYFETYPGVWRHGDWIRFTERGSCVIEGRSDSTLNRHGVRMGTAEIYSVVEALPEIVDSLVVGVEQPGGGYFMPLFVALTPGVTLTPGLEAKIRSALRANLSPRHVPERIEAVPAIPRTLTGKKLEVPVKRLLMGVPLEQAASLDATAEPAALRHFARLAQQWRRASP